MWHLGGPRIDLNVRMLHVNGDKVCFLSYLPLFFKIVFNIICELKARIIHFNEACNRLSIYDKTLRNKGVKTEIVQQQETVYFTPRLELAKGFTIYRKIMGHIILAGCQQ